MPFAETPAPEPDRVQTRGTAKILWDAERSSGVLHVSDLPPAPDGQEYFLWIKVCHLPLKSSKRKSDYIRNPDSLTETFGVDGMITRVKATEGHRRPNRMAIQAQPVRKASPPIGVTAPKGRMPVSAKA